MAGLLDILMGRSGQEQPQLQAPQQSQGLFGGGFRDTMRNLAPAIAMIDPRNQQMGMALMAANQDRKRQAAGQQQANQTVKYLQEQGVPASEAQMMVSDPQMLRSWFGERQKAGKPDWKIQSLRDDDGNERSALVDMNNPSKFQYIGGVKQDKQSLMNAGDGRIYDPNSGQWISAPDAGNKAPQVVELFDNATGQPYKATWNPQSQEFDRVGGVKARSGMELTTNPDGTVTLTQGSLGGMPKLTESEGRNAGFYGRGVASQQILNDLEKQGTSLWNKAASGLPVVGNYMRSEEAQKYDQAKRDFVNAVLRRESGAVISPEEFANAEQQYFPQPGDGAEVIEQKRKNRETTILGLKVSSGQGAQFALPPQAGGQPQKPAANRFRFNPETGELE